MKKTNWERKDNELYAFKHYFLDMKRAEKYNITERYSYEKGVLNELKEEKIDVVEYSEDPVQYIASSLSPATVLAVDINADEMTSKVVGPDSQLSLAIGKDGQNARLAARLTGWKIDIKSESQIKGEA